MEAWTTATQTHTLAIDDIHIWYAGAEYIAQLASSAHPVGMLSNEERTTSARFLRRADVDTRLAARVLLRTSLSRYAPIAPASWEFRAEEAGKPTVAGPRGAPRLRFSVAHTRELVTVAVALRDDVGIDAESVDPHLGGTLMRSALADAEWHHLVRLPPQARPRRFCELWTLKEAYLKARGIGLRQSLQDFAFILEDGRRPRVIFSSELHEITEEWQFWQDTALPRHAVALAVRRPGLRPMTVRTFHVTMSLYAPTRSAA